MATLLRRRIKNRYIIVGVGVVFFSLQNYVIPRAFSLTEPCSNNVAEYNTLLMGMQIANEIGVKNFKAYCDSKLIVNQVRGEYEVRYEDLCHITTQTSTWQRDSETFTLICTSLAKCSCCCTGVPRRFFGSSSWSDRENTHLQP